MKKSSIITLVCAMCLLICFSLVSYFFLQKPDFSVSVSFSEDSYNVNWDELDKAKSYKVYINGTEIDTVNTSTYKINDHLVNNGTYKINVVALDEEENKIDEQNFNYEYIASTESDFLRKGTYYINGQEKDYVVESKEELEQLVWHSILYRRNEVDFYVSPNCGINKNNLNQLTKSYIDTYPEYNGVNLGYARYAKYTNTNVGLLCNFTYYLNEDFVLTHNNIPREDYIRYELAKFDYPIDLSFAKPYEKASSTERTFAIDKEGVKEVEVGNTEQLFMAVQHGARPVFTKENSVAEKVYNNAKKVLKEINNSDNLTDYQKAYNIYTYLGNNVKYDYVLYEYMNKKQDFSTRSFGNYSIFYLEGVFFDLDNQYAVCDGLAKAYTLLCRIEGIECYKVNGEVLYAKTPYSQERIKENHAWNKVKIAADESINLNNDTWSIVDVTWGILKVSNGTTAKTTETTEKQILSYLYFLVSEEDLLSSNVEKHTRIVDYVPVGAPTSAITWYKNNYYFDGENTNKTAGNDYYISTLSELENVMVYARDKMKNEGKEVLIEIRISSAEETLKAKMNEFIDSATSEQKRKNWYISLGVNDAKVESILVDTSQKVFDDYCLMFKFS